MIQLGEQPRRAMIQRQRGDVIRQIATSSEYSANVLRVMNQPRQHNPEWLKIFDTHSDDAIHATQADVNRLNEKSTRPH